MTLSSIKSFKLELDGAADAAFTGGEVVSGLVVLKLRRDTRVHSMKVQGRGVATAHWLESRGMNSVSNDYTSKVTYFRKRQHLIRGSERQRGKTGSKGRGRGGDCLKKATSAAQATGKTTRGSPNLSPPTMQPAT
uniref:Arrestin-like N-terminal domain-containing protein n=1 Tax=Labrus bergylta TaxID=56723 RepID=A0A3Q3GZT0_9LABR